MPYKLRTRPEIGGKLEEVMILVRIRNVETGKRMAGVVCDVQLQLNRRTVNGGVKIKQDIKVIFGPIWTFSKLYSCEQWDLVESRPICRADLLSPELEHLLENEKWEME